MTSASRGMRRVFHRPRGRRFRGEDGRSLRRALVSSYTGLERHRLGDEAGFGLIEVLISLVVLLVVLVPATFLIDTTVQQTSLAKQKVSAVELAEQELEQLGNLPMTVLDSYLDRSVQQSTPTVAGVTYTVTSYLHWQGVGSSPDLCQSGSPPQAVSATATVSWGPGGVQKLAEQSVISPPYGLAVFDLGAQLTLNVSTNQLTASTNQTIPAGAQLTIGVGTSFPEATVNVSSAVTDSTTIGLSSSFKPTVTYPVGTPVALPDDGYLGIQINGASGSAPSDISQVYVKIESNSTNTTNTYYPDTTGCVYEQELPGTYTVTLGSTSTPPFVGATQSQIEQQPPGQVIASTTASVSAGSTTILPVTYDQSDVVTFSPSGGVPVAGGTPVSVQNTSIQGGGATWAVVIPVGSTNTSADLFPFSSSAYSVWYGDCLGEEPAGPATVTATPGGSSGVSITGLGELTVQADKTPTGNPPPVWSTGPSFTATIADPNSSTDGCPLDKFNIPAPSSGSSSEAAMVELTRTDSSASWTNGSDLITDASATAADVGKEVFGTGIPTPAYVGKYSSGTITIYTTPTGTTPAPTTQLGSNAAISLVGETYTVTATETDGHSNSPAATAFVTPGGVDCTSGCIGSPVWEPSGTPVPVVVS